MILVPQTSLITIMGGRDQGNQMVLGNGGPWQEPVLGSFGVFYIGQTGGQSPRLSCHSQSISWLWRYLMLVPFDYDIHAFTTAPSEILIYLYSYFRQPSVIIKSGSLEKLWSHVQFIDLAGNSNKPLEAGWFPFVPPEVSFNSTQAGLNLCEQVWVTHLFGRSGGPRG